MSELNLRSEKTWKTWNGQEFFYGKGIFQTRFALSFFVHMLNHNHCPLKTPEENLEKSQSSVKIYLETVEKSRNLLKKVLRTLVWLNFICNAGSFSFPVVYHR